MERTLIIHNNPLVNTKLLHLLEKVFGPSLVQNLDDFNDDINSFSSLVFLIHSGDNNVNVAVTQFFENNRNKLKEINIAIIFDDQDSSQVAKDKMIFNEISSYLNECYVITDQINYEYQEEMISKLINIKRNMLDTTDMPQDRLTEEINQILGSHNTCTLCTGFNNSLRATPIEYIYNLNSASLYFLSEGGEKFAYLSANPQVAIAIYHEFNGFDKLEGIQIEGTVEMIEIFSDEYIENAKLRGLSLTSLKKLPSKLNMFKVIPRRISLLNSELKKEGYCAKQVLNFKE